MQTCPNCGSESRIGAKFCTSCGYRFVENGGLDSQADATRPSEPAPAWGASQSAADESIHHEGWPTAAASAEAAESGWENPAASAPATEPALSPVSESEMGAAGFWPEAASDTWPSATTAPVLGASDGDAASIHQRIAILNRELARFSPLLAEKAQLIVLNKADSVEDMATLCHEVGRLIGKEVLAISGVSGYGLRELEDRLLVLVPAPGEIVR